MSYTLRTTITTTREILKDGDNGLEVVATSVSDDVEISEFERDCEDNHGKGKCIAQDKKEI